MTRNEAITLNLRNFALLLAVGIAPALPVIAQQLVPAQPVAPAATIPPDQQPTREQLLKLFEVMRVRQQMDTILKAIPEMASQQIHNQVHQGSAGLPGGAALTPPQQAKLDEFEQKALAKAMTIYPIEEMLNDMIPIYQRHLSRSDVDAFTAFYSTPAAQRLIDEQPAMMRELMPVLLGRITERSKALADEMTKERMELLKSIPPPPPLPASKPGKP